MMNELADKYGYKPSGQCHCDGHLTHKFRKGNYEIRWRKSRYLFRVKELNHFLCEWKPIIEAETYLKQLHEPVPEKEA